MRLTVTKHFADQMVPTAGMSGNVVVVDRLCSLGAAKSTAVAAVILTIIGYYASYAVIALAALILLWMRDSTSSLIVGSMVAFFVVATAIPALALWLQKNGDDVLPPWLAAVRAVARPVGHDRQSAEQAGAQPPPDRRAQPAQRHRVRARRLDDAILPVRPRRQRAVRGRVRRLHHGLDRHHARPDPDGAWELRSGQHRHLRSMGVPFEAAISATLLFRGFTLWVPLIPGTLAARRDLKRRKPKKTIVTEPQ